MTINKRDVISSLKKKGFYKNDEGRHIKLIYDSKDDEDWGVFTLVSHGSKKDLPHSLISAMAKQCKISKGDFLKLVKCPLSKEKYKEKLEEKFSEIDSDSKK